MLFAFQNDTLRKESKKVRWVLDFPLHGKTAIGAHENDSSDWLSQNDNDGQR